MEDLFSENKIGALEEKIDGLIKTYKGMKDEKVKLIGKIESLETENKELKVRMSEVQKEKELVMQKVKGILEKVEKIEI